MGLAKHPREAAVCKTTGKDQLSRSAAKSLVKRIQRTQGANVSEYECRSCGTWHVGKRRRR